MTLTAAAWLWRLRGGREGTTISSKRRQGRWSESHRWPAILAGPKGAWARGPGCRLRDGRDLPDRRDLPPEARNPFRFRPCLPNQVEALQAANPIADSATG